MPRSLGLLLSCVLLIGVCATTATADPPRPGTTDSGLNESEAATLWSNQSGDGYLTPEEYRAAYGENRTTIHQIANGTDLTFTEPPSMAQRWTRYAHRQYTPGGDNASVYPPHAETRDSEYIKDAHATVFAVSPATRTYLESGEVRLYVAPEGHLLGTVDYRVEAPPPLGQNLSSTQWELSSSEISEVRLYADDERIATTSGSHRPNVSYALDEGVETLRLEADIEVALLKTTVRENGTGGNVTQLEREVTVLNDSVTVTDTINVDVYDLQAVSYRSEYPGGETGVAVFQSEPWQGYTLNRNGTERVRGVWRFFNARRTNWDTLTRATRDDEQQVDSIALPVYVHAYPSEIGPRSKPEYGGPTILRVWGNEHASPAGAIPENVSVEVIEESYESTYGIAVQSRHVDREHVTVHGIVHGTQTTPVKGTREIRESSLSAAIIAQNDSGVRVHLELTDSETGAPIVLQDSPRIDPVTDDNRSGHIEIAGKQVKTNATGEAVVFLSGTGTYTARYQPESWLTADPAYAGDSAIVRWHPLVTVSGWVNLFVRAGLALLPLGVAWFAGKQLSSLIHWRRF
jgi:hypothetical protein